MVRILAVEGFEIRRDGVSQFDGLTIVDGEERSAHIKIEVGDRDFAGLDLGHVWTEPASSADAGGRREI